MLKALSVTGASAAVWQKPAMDSILLPAHAVLSAPMCTVPPIQRISFTQPGNSSTYNAGDATSNISFPLDAVYGTDTYVTAWGFREGSSEAEYINADFNLLWSSDNVGIAHTGTSSSFLGQQSGSSITPVSEGSTVIRATWIEYCGPQPQDLEDLLSLDPELFVRVEASYNITIDPPFFN